MWSELLTDQRELNNIKGWSYTAYEEDGKDEKDDAILKARGVMQLKAKDTISHALRNLNF